MNDIFGVSAVQEMNLPLFDNQILTYIPSKTIEPYKFAEGKHFIGNKFETIFLKTTGPCHDTVTLPRTFNYSIATTVESLNSYREG
jgi:hypothetical protein